MKNEISDVSRVLKRLISYFRIQEDTSSQREKVELWNRIESSIDAKQHRRRIYQWSAVSVVALLAGCIWLGIGYFKNESSDLYTVASQMIAKAVEAKEIQLIVSSKKTLWVKDGSTVTYSREGGIHVDEEKVIVDGVMEVSHDQIIVPKGRFGRLILSDGSELYINSGTKVIYPSRFDKGHREIFVDGEIFIDVQRDEKVPFVVKTARFDVEVLGTAFDVKTYSDSSCGGEIILLRGLVNVKSHVGDEVVLYPDNKAIIPAEGIIQTVAVEASDYVLWTKSIFPLNNGTLGDIIDDLSRFYDVKIICSDDIRGVRITGKIDLQQGIEEALRNLSLAGGFICSKAGDTYILDFQVLNE